MAVTHKCGGSKKCGRCGGKLVNGLGKLGCNQCNRSGDCPGCADCK